MKLYFLLWMALMTRCNTVSKSTSAGSDSAYVREIMSARQQKDENFAMSPNSPFADLEADFTGLRYYAADPAWNLKVSLVQPDTVYTRHIPDTKGGMRAYIYSGHFQFSIAGTPCQLPVWRDSADTDVMFLMFRDKTNADSTYGGGRYIERPWPENFADFTLDFNLSFNPYCHYNHDYSCPVVPKEFTLPVRVEAGEKRYR